MRRTAKGTRAPLAPLHNNSLRGDSPRKAVTKADVRQILSSVGQKPVNKQRKAPQAKPNKADLEAAREVQDASSKTAVARSPTRSRKSVRLVTTTAAAAKSETAARIKQEINKIAEAPSCKQTAVAPTSVASQLDRRLVKRRAAKKTSAQQSAQSGALASATAGHDDLLQAPRTEAGICATSSTQADAITPSPGALRHWQVPATPPSISALLGALKTPAGVVSTSRDMQYLPTQATPQSAVHGVGTPQDFSDVFDLDDVSLCISAHLYDNLLRQVDFMCSCMRK